MNLGEKLSVLRKQRGMTQMELAEMLDISRQAVSRWEQGVSEPSTENLVGIGKLFNVPVDVLVNESAQLQVEVESAVQVAVAEKKEQPRNMVDNYSNIKLFGIVLFIMAVAAVLVIFITLIGSGKDKQNTVPMEDFDKDIINSSEIIYLPID